MVLFLVTETEDFRKVSVIFTVKFKVKVHE